MLNKPENISNVLDYLNGDLTERQNELRQKMAEYIDLTELDAILDSDKNLLTVACAGAGKTVSLILRLIYDSLSFQANERVLVSTFLSSGAEDVRNSYLYWCSMLGVKPSANIEFRTLHSTFLNILKKLGVNIDINHTARQNIIREWNKDNGLFSKRSLTSAELEDINLLISYTSNTLYKVERHTLLDTYAISSARWKLAYVDFLERKKRQKVYDFDDIQTLLYNAYQTNSDVKDFAGTFYTRLYLDEVQDTSDIQYALLRPMLDSAKFFMVIGDDDQTIYSWRGSNKDIILKLIPSHYDVDVKFLTVNRRCKTGVLNPVIPCILQNENRFEKELKACEEGGKTILHPYYSGIKSVKMLQTLLSLCDKVFEDDDPQTRLLIVSRNNADLSIPILYLALKDYGFALVGTNLDPTKGKIFGFINHLLALFARGKGVTSEALKLLDLTPPQIRQLRDILINNDITLFDINPADLRNLAPALSQTLDAISKLDEVANSPDSHSLVYLQLDLVMRHIYKAYFKERSNSFSNAVYALFSFLKIHMARDVKTMHELILNVNKLCNNVSALSRDVGDSPKVSFSTVHVAKGKTYSHVVVWNMSQGVFPSRDGDSITPEQLEEERSIVYIGLTRAIEENHIFVDYANPSPFLRECDLSLIENGEYLNKDYLHINQTWD